MAIAALLSPSFPLTQRPAKSGVMNSSSALVPRHDSAARWKFLRDVLVFQLKMLLDNLRDFALMPVSLGAAFFGLIFKGEREGRSSIRCSDGARIARE